MAETPYTSNVKSVDSATYVQVMGLDRCYFGRGFTVRLSGQNVDWRVVCNGYTGQETVQSGVIPAGTVQTVRVAGLPAGPWGGAELVVEARLSSGTTATDVRVEAAWTPQEMGPARESPRLIGERAR